MRVQIWKFLISALLVLGIAGYAAAAEFSKEQRHEMENIISDYLLGHPELLKEMSDRLAVKEKLAETEQRKGALVSGAKEIFHNTADYVAGNAKAKTTLVEFFDYNCGWCKKVFRRFTH